MSYFVRLQEDVKTSYSAQQKGALQAALLLLSSFQSAQGWCHFLFWILTIQHQRAGKKEIVITSTIITGVISIVITISSIMIAITSLIDQWHHNNHHHHYFHHYYHYHSRFTSCFVVCYLFKSSLYFISYPSCIALPFSGDITLIDLMPVSIVVLSAGSGHIIPDGVQRCVSALYGDVTDRDDVRALGGACLHWLRLHQVGLCLRGGTACEGQRGVVGQSNLSMNWLIWILCWESDLLSVCQAIGGRSGSSQPVAHNAETDNEQLDVVVVFVVVVDCCCTMIN